MKKVFIIHGFAATPNSGWFPWLMAELAKKNIFACSVPMPDPKNPVVSEWIDSIKKYVGEINEDVFILGHSLGVPGVLRYFEALDDNKKLGGAVLVSGLMEPLKTENTESKYRKIDPFVVPKINLKKVKNKANEFVVIHGTDDPAVPFSQAGKLVKALDCPLIKIEGAGHFYTVSDPVVYELPEARDALLKMILK